jgi:hypothetical protein
MSQPTDQMKEKDLLAERDSLKKLFSTTDATSKDAARYADVQAALTLIASTRATSISAK